ncbi:MAG TPA: PEP/pyruvate-binding domain-containing protein, partial [Rhizomicrobium sp.]
MSKWVYAFGNGAADGRAEMSDLLGGKGANLAEMSNLGLPVPPGFTITTEVCAHYYAHKGEYPPDLKPMVETALQIVGDAAQATLGHGERPLLVSVRSGARVSMPGMMDTVLNLGLNPVTAEALARLSGDRRFAYDSWRRFVHMYANVVLGLPHERFEEILELEKETRGVEYDTDLDADDLKRIAERYRQE